MVEVWPEIIGFGGGEAGQDSFSMYLHGSPDGGVDVYSGIGGTPAAVFHDDDGGFGRVGADPDVSFAGHSLDDAGTGGPYSSRIAALVTRHHIADRAVRATLTFRFDAASSGERVAVYVRAVADTLTGWKTRGTAGTGSPHYFLFLRQGFGLVVDDSGNFSLYEYGASGARVTIATGSTAVSLGVDHTISIEATDDDTPILRALLDGATDPFGGDQVASGSTAAPSRGHVGFGLTKTASTLYPFAKGIEVEDMSGAAAVTIYSDDGFNRAPVALTGTIVPTGAGGQPTVTELPHKLFEWGGHRVAVLGGVDVGPWLTNGGARYGPEDSAAGITSPILRDWLNPMLRTVGTADYIVAATWKWKTKTGINTLFGNVGCGVAVRCTKSAPDASVPDLSTSTGYLMRAIFGGDPNTTGVAPYFELLRVVAGAETILATRPFQPWDWFPGEAHRLALQVETNGSGHPELTGYWERPGGTRTKVFDAIVDDDGSKITAENQPGMALVVGGVNGNNPMFQVTRFEVLPLTVQPPSLASEVVSFGPIPHAPEFPADLTKSWQAIQHQSERGYVQSWPEFEDARHDGTLTWLLETTEADEVVTFLRARYLDRLGFDVVVDGVTITLFMANEDIPTMRRPGGIVEVGPVQVLESLA